MHFPNEGDIDGSRGGLTSLARRIKFPRKASISPSRRELIFLARPPVFPPLERHSCSGKARISTFQGYPVSCIALSVSKIQFFIAVFPAQAPSDGKYAILGGLKIQSVKMHF